MKTSVHMQEARGQAVKAVPSIPLLNAFMCLRYKLDYWVSSQTQVHKTERTYKTGKWRARWHDLGLDSCYALSVGGASPAVSEIQCTEAHNHQAHDDQLYQTVAGRFHGCDTLCLFHPSHLRRVRLSNVEVVTFDSRKSLSVEVLRCKPSAIPEYHDVIGKQRCAGSESRARREYLLQAPPALHSQRF